MKKNDVSTRRRIGLGLIVIILLLIVYQIFSVFIWGLSTAEKELSKYAKEVLEFNEEIECQFDWYNDRYVALNYLDHTLDYRRQNKTIYDGAFSQKEEEKANYDYGTLTKKMPDHLSLPSNITVWTEISVDDYDAKVQRLYLLSIFNTEDISEEASLLEPASIAMKVVSGLGENYNFTGIQVVYFDKNGMFEIAFPADSFERVTMEKLLVRTKQISVDKYPESYVNWLIENKFD